MIEQRRIVSPLRGWGLGYHYGPRAYALGYYMPPLRGWLPRRGETLYSMRFRSFVRFN